jgi:hypothetical protein
MTDFIQLTEMWQNREFNKVAEVICDSKEFLEKDRLIDFCAYFQKYLGENELKVLSKLIQR